MCAGVVCVSWLSACESQPSPSANTPSSLPAKVQEKVDTSLAPQDELRNAIAAAERFARLDAAFGMVQAIESGRKRAIEAASATLGAGQYSAVLVGLRSGFPAYSVSRQDGGARLLVVTSPDEVLVGAAGWQRFRELQPSRNPQKWAAAWLVLELELAREPMGAWSNPAVAGPLWDGDALVFAHEDEAGRRRRLAVRFDAAGRGVARDVAWQSGAP